MQCFSALSKYFVGLSSKSLDSAAFSPKPLTTVIAARRKELLHYEIKHLAPRIVLNIQNSIARLKTEQDPKNRGWWQWLVAIFDKEIKQRKITALETVLVKPDHVPWNFALVAQIKTVTDRRPGRNQTAQELRQCLALISCQKEQAFLIKVKHDLNGWLKPLFCSTKQLRWQLGKNALQTEYSLLQKALKKVTPISTAHPADIHVAYYEAFVCLQKAFLSKNLASKSIPDLEKTYDEQRASYLAKLSAAKAPQVAAASARALAVRLK